MCNSEKKKYNAKVERMFAKLHETLVRMQLDRIYR